MAANAECAKTLCGHLKACLSGKYSDKEIQTFVGYLNGLDDNSYKCVTSDMSCLMTSLLSNEHSEVRLANIVRLKPIIDNGSPDKVNPRDLTFEHPFHILNNIVRCERESVKSRKLWSDLSNLKSVRLREDTSLSVREKNDAYHSIIHKAPEIDEDTLQEWEHFVNVYVPYLVSDMRKPEYDMKMPLWAIPASDTKMLHYQEVGKGRVVTTALSKLDTRLYSLRDSFRNLSIYELAEKYPSEFASRVIVGEDVECTMDLSNFPRPTQRLPIGRIGISPKNGMKPRVVGEMEPTMASLSYPIGRVLKSINTQWPSEWVDSHDGARKNISLALKLNRESSDPDEFISFDQSAFTDNYNYQQIQRPVLLALQRCGWLTPFDIEIVDLQCQGDYDLNVLRKGHIKPYGTGTSMGSFPSFPLASLCNGLMASFAYHKARGVHLLVHPIRNRHERENMPPTSPFWVVGDDIVIQGADIAHEYEDFCHKIGLKINPDKSIRSKDCVEFCSRFIFDDAILPKFKLAALKDGDYSQLMNQYEHYGKESFLARYTELTDVIHILEELPKPYGLAEPVKMSEDTNYGDVRDLVKTTTMLNRMVASYELSAWARDAYYGFYRRGQIPSGTTVYDYPDVQVVHRHEEHGPPETCDLSTIEKSMLRDMFDIYNNSRCKGQSSQYYTREDRDRIQETYQRLFGLEDEFAVRNHQKPGIAPSVDKRGKHIHEPNSARKLLLQCASFPESEGENPNERSEYLDEPEL